MIDLPGLAFCLGFKNWHLTHLERCLASIRCHFDGLIVLADLGSTNFIGEVLPLVQRYRVIPIHYPVSEWSRSLALNLARKALPRWNIHALVFTDADMLFPRSWFETVRLSPMAETVIYLTRARDLTGHRTAELNMLYSFDDDWLYTYSSVHPPVGQGGGMIIPIEWFDSVGGFDEFYKVWGGEDNDLIDRATWDGMQVLWLPHHKEGAWVVHQYHPRDWPTPEQFAQVTKNKAYYAQRKLDGGPIIRNRHGIAPSPPL